MLYITFWSRILLTSLCISLIARLEISGSYNDCQIFVKMIQYIGQNSESSRFKDAYITFITNMLLLLQNIKLNRTHAHYYVVQLTATLQLDRHARSSARYLHVNYQLNWVNRFLKTTIKKRY